MKDILNVLLTIFQGFIGLLIVLKVISINAIAWVWFIYGAIVTILFIFVGVAKVLQESREK